MIEQKVNVDTAEALLAAANSSIIEGENRTD